MAELRDDLRPAHRHGQGRLQAQMALRENALAALVELVDEAEVPESLVDDEVRQRLHDLGHRLEEQRISIEQFLEATGRTGEELVAEIRVEAHRAVKADLALRALAEAEALEVTDDELDGRDRGHGRPAGDRARPSCASSSTTPAGPPRYARSRGRPRR